MDDTELVARITELRAGHSCRVAVGISGPDCAGKSTLAATLARALEPPALVVAGDEFTQPTRAR